MTEHLFHKVMTKSATPLSLREVVISEFLDWNQKISNPLDFASSGQRGLIPGGHPTNHFHFSFLFFNIVFLSGFFRHCLLTSSFVRSRYSVCCCKGDEVERFFYVRGHRDGVSAERYNDGVYCRDNWTGQVAWRQARRHDKTCETGPSSQSVKTSLRRPNRSSATPGPLALHPDCCSSTRFLCLVACSHCLLTFLRAVNLWQPGDTETFSSEFTTKTRTTLGIMSNCDGTHCMVDHMVVGGVSQRISHCPHQNRSDFSALPSCVHSYCAPLYILNASSLFAGPWTRSVCWDVLYFVARIHQWLDGTWWWDPWNRRRCSD